MIKNLPAMRETWFHSLGWEDPLKEGMASHSSILAWRIPMDRGAWRAAIQGAAKGQTALSAAQHMHLSALMILFSYSKKFSVKFLGQREWNYYVRDKIFRKFGA